MGIFIFVVTNSHIIRNERLFGLYRLLEGDMRLTMSNIKTAISAIDKNKSYLVLSIHRPATRTPALALHRLATMAAHVARIGMFVPLPDETGGTRRQTDITQTD